MRMLVGIACLVGLFLLSSTWHRSRMDRLVNAPGAAHAAEPAEHPLGWGEVLIGAASGAEPVFLEPPPRPPRAASGAPGTRGAQAASAPDGGDGAPAPGDWELRVKSGDVLSRIVRLHYGRVSPDLERRLARYNGLDDPDQLEVGQVLYLPPEERLEAE